MSEPITADLLRQCLPKAHKNAVTDGLVDRFNAAASGDHADTLRDNILGYLDVLQDGKFKIDDYLSAVKYVSYKLMGKSNRTSYALTFPARYNRLSADPTLCEEIDSYVTAYNRGKLVNLIWEQAMVPVHVLNQDYFQKALNVQMDLAMNAKSEMVRSQAASSVLTILKAPEAAKIKLDVNIKHDNSIEDLRSMMVQVVEQQQAALEAGTPLKQITSIKPVIEGDFVDVSAD